MPPRHTPEDIERGLTALAIAGNSHKAAEMSGFRDRTLRLWREKHADRYAEIQAQRAPLIDAACIQEFRNVVLNAANGTLEAVELTRTQLHHDRNLPKRAQQLLAQLATTPEDERAPIFAELDRLAPQVKDASAAAKNLATTAAIASDKIALMEGRPTSIVEHRSSDDVLRDLERGGFIDAEATEDPEPPQHHAQTPLMPERADDNARELPESTG
jgi:hypothetical protein